MKKKILKNWNLFKVETAEEEQSLEELKNDLEGTGIDLQKFTADIKKTVRSCYRETSKSLAEAGITEKKALLEKVYESVIELSRVQIFQRIRELAEKGNSEALVFCREKTDADISDDDLRYLLADFIINEGEGDVTK